MMSGPRKVVLPPRITVAFDTFVPTAGCKYLAVFRIAVILIVELHIRVERYVVLYQQEVRSTLQLVVIHHDHLYLRRYPIRRSPRTLSPREEQQ